MKHKKPKHPLSPMSVIALGFLSLILCGALLLSLPAASRAHSPTPFLDALFTSVSATCVTGLVTLDTATHWSAFGQAVILLLIQIGGLGFMTVSVMLSLILKRAISPRERYLVAQSMNVSSFDGIVRFVKLILCGTFLFELLGACLLAIRFVPLFGWGDGLYKSLFHSISAFCNAGFDLMGVYSGEFSSLSAFTDDPLVCLTLCALITLGGLGFVVWRELYELVKYKKPLSLYSRLVLITSFLLTLFGFVFFLLCEWDNTALYGSSGTGTKVLSSLFQSVTLRTAGFSTVNPALTGGPSQLVACILMFIGGSSGGTAGGVKTVTFALVCIALIQSARGRSAYTVGKKRIAEDNIRRALALVGCGLLVVFLSTLLLALTNTCPMNAALYEIFSAFGTVGISLGLTPSLNAFGKILLMVLMYFGRIGLLTLTFAISRRQMQLDSVIAYPADKSILIG